MLSGAGDLGSQSATTGAWAQGAAPSRRPTSDVDPNPNLDRHRPRSLALGVTSEPGDPTICPSATSTSRAIRPS